MKLKQTLGICLLMLLPLESSGQSLEEYKRQAMEDFRSYKEQSAKDFQAYKDSVNAAFARYMRMEWTLTDGHSGIPEPEQKEPDIPPVIFPELDFPEIIDDSEISFSDVIPVFIDDTPTPVPFMQPVARPKEQELSFTYYGTACSVRFDPVKKHKMKDSSENAAADMWLAMSSGDYDNLVYDCLSNKEKLSLCDWAYYTFLDKVVERIYGDCNEGVMLKVFLLSQSGYKTRVARNEKGKLKLLVSLADDLYGYSYFTMDGTHYYLTERCEEKALYIFDRQFPNEKSLRMSISIPPKFSVRESEPRHLCSRRFPDISAEFVMNENLIQFYNDYPSSYKRDHDFSQWVNYANTPVSDIVRNTVYKKLQQQIKSLSQEAAANILLNFVQTAFEYKKDEEYWGRERSFFPEETFYYPFSDCEDRAILFSRLVRDLMGLRVVLLYYPGHLATAVSFTENIAGDYIRLAGDRYLVCDPTYIGAPVGRSMPDMDNSKAVVVMLD